MREALIRSVSCLKYFSSFYCLFYDGSVCLFFSLTQRFFHILILAVGGMVSRVIFLPSCGGVLLDR